MTEPVSTFTYVKSVEAKRNDVGRAVFCKVVLGNGTDLLMPVEDAPKAGDQAEVLVRFTGQPSLLEAGS